MPCFPFFVAAKVLNELSSGMAGETSRMKRKRAEVDPRGRPTEPPFLRAHIEAHGADSAGGSSSAKSTVFKPSWGIRKQDSVVGDTRLSRDWSYHSIPPADYRDIVISRDLEGIESLGCQAIASVFFFSF